MKNKNESTPAKTEQSGAIEKLSDADQSSLNMAKMRMELTISNAKLALAESKNSELAYNNLILQFAMRYGLNDGDKINDNGDIVRQKE